jgi:hypothetical protein
MAGIVYGTTVGVQYTETRDATWGFSAVGIVAAVYVCGLHFARPYRNDWDDAVDVLGHTGLVVLCFVGSHTSSHSAAVLGVGIASVAGPFVISAGTRTVRVVEAASKVMKEVRQLWNGIDVPPAAVSHSDEEYARDAVELCEELPTKLSNADGAVLPGMGDDNALLDPLLLPQDGE